MMTNDKAIHVLLAMAMLALAAATPVGCLAAAKPAAPVRVKAPPPAQEQAITVEELQKHVGDQIIVHTRFNTVRSGTLSKFNQTVLEMKLDSGVDLTVPLNTVRSVAIPQDSSKAEPVKPDVAKPVTPGDGSAKKN